MRPAIISLNGTQGFNLKPISVPITLRLLSCLCLPDQVIKWQKAQWSETASCKGLGKVVSTAILKIDRRVLLEPSRSC